MGLSSRMVRAMIAAGTTGALLSAGTAPSAAASRPAAAGGPWGQTDYNAAQSRANLTEHVLTPATVGRVRYLRGMASPVNPPGGSECENTSVVAPVLTGGGLYAVANHWLTKYDPATGRVLWRRRGPDRFFEELPEALSVADGLVVVGGLAVCDSASGPGGFVQAFRASTGAPVWSQGPGADVVQHMVVSGRYVVTSGDTASDGNVVAVTSLRTGAQVWSRTQDDCCLGLSLVVAGLVLSTASTDQNGHQELIANRIGTGRTAWTRPGTWVLQRGDTDAASGRHVYATNPAGIVAGLNPRTGKTSYVLPAAAQVLAAGPVRVYATCGSLGVCGYAAATGRRLWHTSPGFVPALAAEAGGVLYLDQGPALNIASGRTLATLWAGLTATSLAVGDGRIAVVTDPRVLDLYGLPGS